MTDLTHILSGLNERQMDAVTAEAGPLLVLAGAGSGKTRVLTHRIALLLQSGDVNPWQILAVTFTNKAAREMKERVHAMVDYLPSSMFLGTFHGISNRLLRTHYAEVGLPRYFEILGTDDQKRMISGIMSDMTGVAGLDQLTPNLVQWRINGLKEAGVRSNGQLKDPSRQDQLIVEVYKKYEKQCEIQGLVDFAELILRTVELMKNNATVRDRYQEQFHHVLVDEFQDTNAMQHTWLQLFVAKHQSITAVGDDDQSIYRWRGAQVEHMIQFERHYNNARVIRLEQNYRSTKSILNAANALIENNDSRLGKSLWSNGAKGNLPRYYQVFDETKEANFIAQEIEKLHKAGQSYSEFAVLYRTNAQSQILEQVFTREGIPFQVYGGMRFFDRTEIRLVMAYLHLLINPDANMAFVRCVNNPPRGIGNATIEMLQETSESTGYSMFEAAKLAIDDPLTNRRVTRALTLFVDLMDSFTKDLERLSLPSLIFTIINRIKLIKHYERKGKVENQSRIENLNELQSVAIRFLANNELAGNIEILQEFLSQTMLDAGDRHQSKDDSVQFMTIHSAKGLEFSTVFMAGMMEGLFPHFNSLQDKAQVEEERRLCYVGMTRAMQQLYLISSQTRTQAGQWGPMRQKVSRFVREVPSELMQYLSYQQGYQDSYDAELQDSTYEIGDQVRHPYFGLGQVRDIRQLSGMLTVKVHFNDVGSKWIQAETGKLQLQK